LRTPDVFLKRNAFGKTEIGSTRAVDTARDRSPLLSIKILVLTTVLGGPTVIKGNRNGAGGGF
jgi:hypothetical protein